MFDSLLLSLPFFIFIVFDILQADMPEALSSGIAYSGVPVGSVSTRFMHLWKRKMMVCQGRPRALAPKKSSVCNTHVRMRHKWVIPKAH